MANAPLLEIDLAAIAANYRRLCDEAPSSRIAGVVKADAYGLGAVPVVRTLLEAGCDMLFVARVEEGMALRAAFPAITIVVLDGVVPGSAGELADASLIPVINSIEELEEWRNLANRLGRRLDALLHVETGIHRLGFLSRDLPDPGDPSLAAIRIAGVMSHLACADDPENPMNARQLDEFRRIIELFPDTAASLANSSGIFLGRDFHFDLCRPGIALYGGNPTPGRPNPMQPVVRVTAPVLQVKELDEGGHVGYGATYEVEKGSRLATVAIGYADGLIRASGNRGEAWIGGHRVPFAGRVSMDMVTLDVSSVPPALVQRGSTVELLGEHMGIDELGDAAGTIGYEILTSLSRRYQRRYIETGNGA